MVACLEKTDGNDEFHQIVDFLTTSTIHYALTVSLTIHASYIEQFWATAKSKTVNDVKQIHATVDGKTSVISESSVRSDLHFNDKDGITCLSNDEIFVNLALMGIALAEPFNDVYVTPVHTKKVDDEAVHKELGDRVERAATTTASLDAEQDNGGNTPGSDEERLEQDDLTDFVPPTPHDSPLSGGHTPGSDEGRPNINELMAICTNLSNRVLALETSKTAQDLVINKLKKKVKRLEKKQRARTPGMKLLKIEGDFDDDFDDIDDMVNEAMENVEGDTVNTATTGVSATSASVTTGGVSISTAEPRTPPTNTTTAFEDDDLTISQTLVKMRSQKDKEKGKGVAFRATQEESARPTRILPTIAPKDKGKGIMQEPEKPPKNPIKAQIQRDAKIAQRLFEEEQAQFEREQRIAKERAAEQEAKDAVLIEQMEDIQARIDADELLAKRIQ
ncbi:hypothetical protein Tco_0339183 [Tanacetum coccineum]